jgi:hypothetical protein
VPPGKYAGREGLVFGPPHHNRGADRRRRQGVHPGYRERYTIERALWGWHLTELV